MIAQHAINKLGNEESTWDEFAPFEVNVLAPERTLFEKLAAVHAAVLSQNPATIGRIGRHYYDVARLLDHDSVLAALNALGPDGRKGLVDDINSRSEAAGWDWQPRPDGGYAKSLAFDTQGPFWGSVGLAYTSALDLVHGERPPLERVLEIVQARSELL